MDSMDNFRERFEALEQRTEQLKSSRSCGVSKPKTCNPQNNSIWTS